MDQQLHKENSENVGEAGTVTFKDC